MPVEDPFTEKFLDLLDAYRTKPKAEFEALLAEVDQETLDGLKGVREAILEENGRR
jgi:hypothetical protein